MNRLTADRTGRTVYAGPGEATAIGNLLAQMLAAGEFESLKQAREAVYRSFAVKEYKPDSPGLPFYPAKGKPVNKHEQMEEKI